MEDFIRKGHSAEITKNLTLKWIQDKLRLNNQQMEDLSLPVPDFQLIHRVIAAQLEENAEITMREKRRLGELMVSQLNECQRAAFDQVMAAVNDAKFSIPHQYFLDQIQTKKPKSVVKRVSYGALQTKGSIPFSGS